MSPKDIKVFDSASYYFKGQSNNSMGKCVSKQTSAISIASTDFIGNNSTGKYLKTLEYIPTWTEYGPYNKEDASYCDLNNEGQSESKKSSKKAGPETKGTVMSFGFRKKLHTPKKKSPQEKEKETETIKNPEKYHLVTVIINLGIILTDEIFISDKNGNAGTESTTNENNELKRTIPQVVTSKRDVGSGVLYKTTRFGFRSSNIVRPASVGLTPKLTDFQENVENNNYSEKRRSKSASGSHRSTASNRFNDQSNEYKSLLPKINSVSVNSGEHLKRHDHQQQQQQQEQNEQKQHKHHKQHQQQSFDENQPEVVQRTQNSENSNRPSNECALINTGLHTNVIVKPTAQPAVSVSKFTLHTTSLPKPQYPVPISLTTNRATMDTKSAKQVVNTSRKGAFGPREISADSGISSLENTFDNSNISPRRLRNRPRNLEMVMSGRHTFEVRDLEENMSCESVEPLVLPKLPSAFASDHQTVPLSGLIRTNTIISRDTPSNSQSMDSNHTTNIMHSDAESLDEEKLFRDRSTSEKETRHPFIKDYTTSSKNSSPASSRASWCNAGESLAIKDCSSLSLSSSDESKDHQNEKTVSTHEIDGITLNKKTNTLVSLTESVPKSVESEKERIIEEEEEDEKPSTLTHIAESKFAEMAATVSDVLLDDETSPTDSLVSSSESEDGLIKKSKKRINEDIQEKDIDEISPELDICSPISPGTPTHASNSLSLSDAGRDFLIDDEIADQPALLFSDKGDRAESSKLHHSLADTPTLMENISNKTCTISDIKRKDRSQAAIEHILRTPLSLRKASILNRAESLDTLSPCESIASDDLMLDFESHSSMDSIDRMSQSMRSRCESALQALDDVQLLSDLETKGNEMIREWNNILRVHRTGRDSLISQLPQRATRLLNRSRLQQSQLSNTGSDSPRSGDSLPRKSSRTSSFQLSSRDANSSSDDLFLHDKSFRNLMIQDVFYFKKQLIRLRRVLQEDEENLTRTDTLNPFELGNGQFFTSCALDSNHHSDDKDLTSLTSSTTEDPLQELADLRRQVVYLQGQVDDRDRTIRLQRNLIEKLEAVNQKNTVSVSTSISEKEVINSATQTERVRPLSIGQEGLARNKSECKSFAVYFPATASTTTTSPINQTRRHTIISTTFTNLNHISPNQRRASISWDKFTNYKPVKTTLIGEPITNSTINTTTINNNNNNMNNDDNKFNMNNDKQQQQQQQQQNIWNGIEVNNLHQQNTTKLIKNLKTNSPSKCHLNTKNNLNDLNTEHHTHTVIIV